MAYSELIKNFSRIRDYMREFYIYGFKSRNEYTKKSARSYDDERRRLESWLGDYMQFRQTGDGKQVFLSIDSRVSHHNPFYKAWKTKSFTDGDITLHFILMDILYTPQIRLSVPQIMERIDGYLASFREPKMFDESTVRKKLKEYVSEGILEAAKQGRTILYSRALERELCDPVILDFFSEVSPLGVVGSYLHDKTREHEEYFAFKHHYITGAMDSEILYTLFQAMQEKRTVSIRTASRRRERESENELIPLRIMISVQSGRQYVMAYNPRFGRISSYRTDNIVSVTMGDVSDRFDELRETLSKMQKHLWGVSTQGRSGQFLEHISFTVTYGPNEKHIHQRLEREKRCGIVEKLGPDKSRFSADVYDASELIPWIRTFICRITAFECSDKELESRFLDDIRQMYALYGLEGGDEQ